MSYAFDKRKKNARRATIQNIREDASRNRETLPNSLVMRIMQDQQAENEADKLSRGVTANTPDEVMQEMGSRLGADFSDVQFHSDSLSMSRSDAMGVGPGRRAATSTSAKAALTRKSPRMNCSILSSRGLSGVIRPNRPLTERCSFSAGRMITRSIGGPLRPMPATLN